MIFARIEQHELYIGEGLTAELALDDLIEKFNQNGESIEDVDDVTFWDAEKLSNLVCKIKYSVESR